MDYCLAGDDGTAAMWNGQPDLDLDGDGHLEAIGMDFDGDGMRDDALADFDGDGVADHAVLDLDNDGAAESYFTDDGTGTWAVAVDRGGQLRWFGLDGADNLANEAAASRVKLALRSRTDFHAERGAHSLWNDSAVACGQRR